MSYLHLAYKYINYSHLTYKYLNYLYLTYKYSNYQYLNYLYSSYLCLSYLCKLKLSNLLLHSFVPSFNITIILNEGTIVKKLLFSLIHYILPSTRFLSYENYFSITIRANYFQFQE